MIWDVDRYLIEDWRDIRPTRKKQVPWPNAPTAAELEMLNEKWERKRQRLKRHAEVWTQKRRERRGQNREG